MVSSWFYEFGSSAGQILPMGCNQMGAILNIELGSKNGINGGQIRFWEQNHFKVVPQLKDLVPVLPERLWSNTLKAYFAYFKSQFNHSNYVCNMLFNPVVNVVSNLVNEQNQTFTETTRAKLKSKTHGIIKYVYSDSWKLPNIEKGLFIKNYLLLKKVEP